MIEQPTATTPDVGVPDASWVTLFNRRAYHALNLPDGGEIVITEHRDDDRVVGALSGVLAGGVLTCGWSAPFGGVDFARPKETPARIAATLDAGLARATELGARTVRIAPRAAPYSDNEAYVLYELLNRGFAVQRADLTFVIDLAATPAPEAYRAALKSPARRALKHLEAEEAWAFSELHDEAGWRDAHALLAENRAGKGRTLSLDAEYVLRARAALPDGLRVFGLDLDGRRCAAALIYVAAPGCWYVYAWGDARHELERSPMNLLALHVVEAALAEGVRLLDLGTSSVPPANDGDRLEPDHGLIQFKSSILARPHPRLVLSR